MFFDAVFGYLLFESHILLPEPSKAVHYRKRYSV